MKITFEWGGDETGDLLQQEVLAEGYELFPGVMVLHNAELSDGSVWSEMGFPLVPPLRRWLVGTGDAP